jgi:uncharacterized protein YceH (UPF0502 family)
MQLSPEEGRVIGSLIEKQLTTPQQYPLTLNALVVACNQASNRDPVVGYYERTVEETLAALKGAGLVRFVHPSHGRSVIRYRQVLDERLALDDKELALIGVLLLRGPQTVGELRSRTDRMATFDGIAAVESDLKRLSALPEPLVQRLARRPGQKEERWAQLLSPDAVGSGGAAGGGYASGAVDAAGRDEHRTSVTSPRTSLGSSFTALADEVATLRAEVAELRSSLEDLQAQLGG